jgi:hypothetical protein
MCPAWLAWWHIMFWPPDCETGQPSQTKAYRSLDLSDIGEHGDLGWATDGVIEGHPKVGMNLASAHDHLTSSVLEYAAFVLLTQIFYHSVHDFSLNMTGLQIINMPTKSHLVALNDLVRHTGIIWIYREVNVRQALGELPIVEQASYHCSVESVLALHQ